MEFEYDPVLKARRNQVIEVHNLLKQIQVAKTGKPIDENANTKLWTKAQNFEELAFVKLGKVLSDQYYRAISAQLQRLKLVYQKETNVPSVGGPPPLEASTTGAPPSINSNQKSIDKGLRAIGSSRRPNDYVDDSIPDVEPANYDRPYQRTLQSTVYEKPVQARTRPVKRGQASRGHKPPSKILHRQPYQREGNNVQERPRNVPLENQLDNMSNYNYIPTHAPMSKEPLHDIKSSSYSKYNEARNSTARYRSSVVSEPSFSSQTAGKKESSQIELSRRKYFEILGELRKKCLPFIRRQRELFEKKLGTSGFQDKRNAEQREKLKKLIMMLRKHEAVLQQDKMIEGGLQTLVKKIVPQISAFMRSVKKSEDAKKSTLSRSQATLAAGSVEEPQNRGYSNTFAPSQTRQFAEEQARMKNVQKPMTHTMQIPPTYSKQSLHSAYNAPIASTSNVNGKNQASKPRATVKRKRTEVKDSKPRVASRTPSSKKRKENGSQQEMPKVIVIPEDDSDNDSKNAPKQSNMKESKVEKKTESTLSKKQATKRKRVANKNKAKNASQSINMRASPNAVPSSSSIDPENMIVPPKDKKPDEKKKDDRLETGMQYDSPCSTTSGANTQATEEKSSVGNGFAVEPPTPSTPFSPALVGTVSRDTGLSDFLQSGLISGKHIDWDPIAVVCQEIAMF